jgi:hypothetical protein
MSLTIARCLVDIKQKQTDQVRKHLAGPNHNETYLAGLIMTDAQSSESADTPKGWRHAREDQCPVA